MAELDLGRVVGPKGDAGTNGAPGVGIQSVTQTTTSSADGGSNVMTVTLSNGQKSTFTVMNGSKGSQGEIGPRGEQGPQGERGPAGADGLNGAKGDKGDTGATGPQGPQGEKGDTGSQGPKGDTGATGATGPAGKTPVRGTDYWTEEDKAEIKGYVDEAILGGAW